MDIKTKKLALDHLIIVSKFFNHFLRENVHKDIFSIYTKILITHTYLYIHTDI